MNRKLLMDSDSTKYGSINSKPLSDLRNEPDQQHIDALNYYHRSQIRKTYL